MKLPYEAFVSRADHLIVQMIISSDPMYYWDQYTLLLEACGWTDQEFDAETLRRIDIYWRSFWN